MLICWQHLVVDWLLHSFLLNILTNMHNSCIVKIHNSNRMMQKNGRYETISQESRSNPDLYKRPTYKLLSACEVSIVVCMKFAGSCLLRTFQTHI